MPRTDGMPIYNNPICSTKKDSDDDGDDEATELYPNGVTTHNTVRSPAPAPLPPA